MGGASQCQRRGTWSPDRHDPDPESDVQELIQKLTSQADLTEEQAKQAIDVFIGVIDDRLPDPMVAPVIEALKGNDDAAKQLEAAAEGALSKLGGMFSK